MAERFEPGDEVLHKSGGPKMTVVKFGTFTGQEKYQCKWWDAKKNEFATDTFIEDELKPWDDEKAPPSGPFGSGRGPSGPNSWMGS